MLAALAAWASTQADPVPAQPEIGSDREIGYAEGRIVELVTRSTPPDGALVRLPDGRVVAADLPFPDPDSTFDTPAYRVGERVELYFAPGIQGGRRYVVSDWVRRPALGWLLALFTLASFLVAGLKGLRAVAATAVSLWIVIAFIVPRILAGWDPVLVSLLGVGGILLLAIYFVHGVSWSTTAALAGTYAAVGVTMLLGIVFSDGARLTGLGTEDAIYLLSAAPQIALRGLLLAGLLIGALGALTDITIVQASVVRELAHTDPTLGLGELYRRGMNVGRDHVGSLVNTLVLAYTGSGLALLILLEVNDVSLARALNLELVASEVVHTLVGSIGLILAVPITTLLAAWWFRGDRLPIAPGELQHAHHHH
ncbi:MAG: YibE/F family protein [Trueperaceae bacterium]|nr:YibE/F family protein [Trueperaceae bacterium]